MTQEHRALQAHVIECARSAKKCFPRSFSITAGRVELQDVMVEKNEPLFSARYSLGRPVVEALCHGITPCPLAPSAPCLPEVTMLKS